MLRYEIVESDIQRSGDIDSLHVMTAIEEIIDQYGLTITQKTTLTTMKGSIHYHLKQGKSRGVLEITYWPQAQQLFLEIHDNRQADWNLYIIRPMAHDLAVRFNGVVESFQQS
jgi:hypothetical protein